MLNKLAKEKAMNKCLHIMFSSISHEFRTPLNAFINSVELLSSQCNELKNHTSKVPPSQLYPLLISHFKFCEKHLKIALVSSKMLQSLTEDVLDFAKIEAGIFSLNTSPFSISSLAKELCYIFDHQCKGKGLQFSIKILDSDFPKLGNPLIEDKFNSDKDRIRQILINLVSNSFKFTNQGGIFVEISLTNSQKGPRILTIKVEDTGVGISKEDQPNLFRVFGMIHKNRDEFNMKGTGLGLTICQKLVQSMGGEIKLNSEEGKGTEVTFTILEDAKEEQKVDLFEKRLDFSNQFSCDYDSYICEVRKSKRDQPISFPDFKTRACDLQRILRDPF